MSKKKEIILSVALLVFLAIIVAPFFYTMKYSLLGPDDYQLAAAMKGKTWILGSIQVTAEFYMNWIGQWFYILWECLFNPAYLFHAGSDKVGYEMIAWTIYYMAAVYFFIRVFAKRILKANSRILALTIFVLFMFALFFSAQYKEIFYWFVGSALMFAAANSMITMALTILYFDTDKKSLAIITSIVGFLTCNEYMIAVFTGSFYLMLFYIKYFKAKDYKKLIPFLFMVLGGVSAVVAPGNFARMGQQVNDHQVGVLLSFAYSFYQLGLWIKATFSTLSTLLCVILAFVLGMYLSTKNDSFEKLATLKLAVWTLIITLAALYLTCYPPVFGGYSLDFPNRIIWIENAFALLGLFFAMMFLGASVQKKVSLNTSKIKVLAIVATILLTSISLLSKNYQTTPYYLTATSIERTKYVSEEWKRVLREIENSPEAHVFVQADFGIQYTDILYIPFLNQYYQWTTNGYVATVYDKEAVSMQWIE